MAHKTNRKALKELIDNLEDLELAVLRERILCITAMSVKDIDKWRSRGGCMFIHEVTFLKTFEKIIDIIGFEEDKNSLSLCITEKIQTYS